MSFLHCVPYSRKFLPGFQFGEFTKGSPNLNLPNFKSYAHVNILRTLIDNACKLKLKGDSASLMPANISRYAVSMFMNIQEVLGDVT